MIKTGIPFSPQPNGEWALPCGCRLHVWETTPSRYIPMTGEGRYIYLGTLAPRLHPCAEHAEPAAPIPMLLWCPACHKQHVDVGEFATRPHRTHRCTGEDGKPGGCGHEWRPAHVRTVGVEELP